MRKFIFSSLMGFIINNVVATLVSLLLLNPLLNASFEGTVRAKEQGLNMPYLLSGYLLLSVLMTWLYRKLNLGMSWILNGFFFGLIIGGIIFVSGHLIVAGWSILPGSPMLISGSLDCLSTIATGIFIAFIYRHENA